MTHDNRFLMKKILSEYLTNDEQRILFLIIFFIVLGLILGFFDYLPPKEINLATLNRNHLELKELAQEDFFPSYNLSSVTYEELLTISGIGSSTAFAIIDYQQEVGFKSQIDLLNVKGIGDAKYNNFKKYLFVEEDSLNTNSVIDSLHTFEIHKKKNFDLITFDDLISIKGIGEKTAIQIIELNKVDKIQSYDDFLKIKGIGEKKLAEIKKRIYFDINRSDSDFSEEKSDGIALIHDKININFASENELVKLKGIVQVKALEIIKYREQNGLFKSIEEIKLVKGIGDKTFNQIKENIEIGDF